VFPAIGQLSANGLLDHAKGVCGEVLIFAFGHGAIMPRIRGGRQPQEFQTVPLPGAEFHCKIENPLYNQIIVRNDAHFPQKL
jgi:hypothetical protein